MKLVTDKNAIQTAIEALDHLLEVIGSIDTSASPYKKQCELGDAEAQAQDALDKVREQ